MIHLVEAFEGNSYIRLHDTWSQNGDSNNRFMLNYVLPDKAGTELYRDFRDAYNDFQRINNLKTPVQRYDRDIWTEADLQDVMAQVNFQNSIVDFGWKLHYKKATIEDKNAWAVYATFGRPDTNTGSMGEGRGRYELIEPGYTETRCVFVFWTIFQMLIQHETMEGFHYEGVRILNPHSSVWALASIQEKY